MAVHFIVEKVVQYVLWPISLHRRARARTHTHTQTNKQTQGFFSSERWRLT